MGSELYKKRLEEDDGNHLDTRTLSSAEEFDRSGSSTYRHHIENKQERNKALLIPGNKYVSDDTSPPSIAMDENPSGEDLSDDGKCRIGIIYFLFYCLGRPSNK